VITCYQRAAAEPPRGRGVARCTCCASVLLLHLFFCTLPQPPHTGGLFADPLTPFPRRRWLTRRPQQASAARLLLRLRQRQRLWPRPQQRERQRCRGCGGLLQGCGVLCA